MNTQPGAGGQAAGQPAPHSRRALVVLALALVAAGAGVAWLALPRTAVSTDNAYVKADTSVVSAKVKGRIAEVLVGDNQSVRAGDPLVRLEDADYRARVAAAESELARSSAAVEAAEAALERLSAEESLAAARVDQARTAIAAAEAERVRAAADRKRTTALSSVGFAAQQDLETKAAAATTADSRLAGANASLEVAKAEASVTSGRRAELQAAITVARAQKSGAEASLDLARQDLDDTVIRSPIDGVVGDRQARAGEYVAAGGRLMAIVPMNALYVVANFKETQTARMVTGQKAEIRIDALPGHAITGAVESFAPGSGSEFALLPFEPGTGNFTKIVQRVPVRIKLAADGDALAGLRPGLSAEVTVRLDPPGS
jgi:membrane fusion protein (multidrug efflux system)